MAAAAPGRVSYRRSEIADRFVIRAAGLAPSVHNTQPWYFTSSQGVIRLYADPGRRLQEADPAGREMVISCGAALANLSLAMRHLGFAADVRLLPDVTRSGLLAEVRWGWYAPPTPDEDLLYRSIPRRHTQRGPFATGVPPLLTGELIRLGRKERVDLHIIYDIRRQGALASLVRTAEDAQRARPGMIAERLRWARQPGESRSDGVQACTRPMRYDGPEFAVREVPGDAGGAAAMPERPDDPHAIGLVALLSTRDDRRPGWLLAGQALQRLLLYATARGVDAAFHTQPLELAITRELIREEFTEGLYPQMLLRLGCGGQATASPRRPVTGTLRREEA
jgi:nitroreductase